MSPVGTGMQLRKAARIILVGAPGVGKGTQTERMLKRFPQLSSISSGDLLRENVRKRTPLGIQAQHLMNSGSLVPDTMILRLIRNALTTKGWLLPKGGPKPLALNFSVASELDPIPDALAQTDAFVASSGPRQGQETEYEYSDHPDASFILDGFPRTAAQASQLDRMIPINLVVDIRTPTEIILDRICNRWIHPASGRVYNTTFNAPQVDGRDDVTGEALVQRDDDKPEVWQKRLKHFDQTSLPLLEHYDKQGVLWRVQGNSSDEISPKIFAEFQRRFAIEQRVQNAGPLWKDTEPRF